MTNPTWAGRSAAPPTPENRKERAGWVPVAGVIAALGLVGAGGYILGSTDDGTDVAAASSPSTTALEVAETTAEQTTVEDSAVESSAAASEEGSTGTTTDTNALETESSPPAMVDGDEAATPADDPVEPTQDEGRGEANVIVEEGEVRGAVLRDGVLYLGGEVPSREVADQIIERAAAVVGEDNIVDEYVINPDVTMEQGAPLYVDNVVLFAYGDNRYDPAFEPLLDLGLALLMQNPSVTVTIITHTDASGSASYNHQLSFERGQSVAQYWVDRGVPVEQIAIDARGERDPRASNDTDEGAQLNRRAEFYIEGLLP